MASTSRAPRVEGDHGRLVEHEALALGVDQRVGRAEVDGQVARHGASWYGRPGRATAFPWPVGSLDQVTPTPEEPRTEGPDEDDACPGWSIDPDDRLGGTRAEVAGDRPPAPPERAGRRAAAGTRHRSPPDAGAAPRSWSLVGAAAVVAAVAWMVVLLSPGSSTTRPDHRHQRTPADAPRPRWPAAARPPARGGRPRPATPWCSSGRTPPQGTVDLVGRGRGRGRPGGHDGRRTSRACAASPWSARAGSSQPRLGGGDRPQLRHRAGRGARRRPGGAFADDAALADGSADLTLSLVPRRAPAPLALHAHARLGHRGRRRPSPAGRPAGMPAITSVAVGVPAAAGDPLLNAAGDVLGILYDADGATSAPTFLPTQLVLGVADDLRSSSRVVHGWLGVEGSDRRGTSRRRRWPRSSRAARPPGSAGGRGHRRASTRCRCARWPTCGAASTSCPRDRGRAVGAPTAPGAGRGRHPRRVLVACRGEHVRFQRPRQPDGWPPGRPAQGHRVGPRWRRHLVRGGAHPGPRRGHRRRERRERRPAGPHRLRGAGPGGRAPRGRCHRHRAAGRRPQRLLRRRRARASGRSGCSRPTAPRSSSMVEAQQQGAAAVRAPSMDLDPTR